MLTLRLASPHPCRPPPGERYRTDARTYAGSATDTTAGRTTRPAYVYPGWCTDVVVETATSADVSNAIASCTVGSNASPGLAVADQPEPCHDRLERLPDRLERTVEVAVGRARSTSSSTGSSSASAVATACSRTRARSRSTRLR